jgi:hypothetical protein
MSLFAEFPDDPKPAKPAKKKAGYNEPRCGTCQHYERWQCGGSVIGYCGITKANNTHNGKLRTKSMTPACKHYTPITEDEK